MSLACGSRPAGGASHIGGSRVQRIGDRFGVSSVTVQRKRFGLRRRLPAWWSFILRSPNRSGSSRDVSSCASSWVSSYMALALALSGIRVRMVAPQSLRGPRPGYTVGIRGLVSSPCVRLPASLAGLPGGCWKN